MRRLALAFALLALPTPAWAQADAPIYVEDVDPAQLPRRVVNKTDGLRFAWPYLSMAVSPTDSDVIYVGSQQGYIFASKDGGTSWSEQRVRVERGKFVGAIRPSTVGLYPGFSWRDIPRDSVPSDIFSFGANGRASTINADNDKGETLTEWWPSARNLDGTRYERSVFDRSFERRPWFDLQQGSGGADSRLGVGLRAGSKYLSLALRKKRGWAIGINIKQTLTLKAGAPTAVFWLSVNPNDPNDVLAATRDGLLRTTDGGDSWPTVLTGATAAERTMSHVLRNPHDPRNIWVSTNSGMFISNDDGNSFERIVDARLAQYTCLWTTIHAKDRNRVYVGTTSGMFYSSDGGKNFAWVWVQPWPAQNRVRRIAVDPENPDRVLIGTDDGLFVSENVAQEKWDRAGGLQFVGSQMRAVASSGRPGHFLAGDTRDLWETFDAGKTWQIIYFGAVRWDVRLALFNEGSSEDIWLLTTAEVMKLERRQASDIDARAIQSYRQMVAAEPTLSQAILSARQRAGVYRGDLSAYRRGRARYRGFAPRFIAGVLYRDVAADSRRNTLLILDRERQLDEIYAHDGALPGLQWQVQLTWDLSDTVFSGDEAPFGRVFEVTNTADFRIRDMVANLYHERRRTQLAMLTDLDADPRTQLMRDLSMEELTAHLNYLTGNIFPPFKALGGKPR